MAKGSSRSKKLEALERAQKINDALETSEIENAALLSSAGESRPTLESHVLDLLDERLSNTAPPPSQRKGHKRIASKKSHRKAARKKSHSKPAGKKSHKKRR